MRAAHHRSRQSCTTSFLGVILASCFAACASEDLAPTIWPPADFLVVVEERAADGGRRRVEVAADGVLVYATAAAALRAGDDGFEVPAFERLSVCQLVPECTRALARKLDRLGIRSLRQRGDEGPDAGSTQVQLRWRAFGSERVVAAAQVLDPAFGAVLRELDGYLPAGEPILGGAVVVSPQAAVLSGVPAPVADPRQAAAFWRARAGAEPDDDRPTVLAFAVACVAGDRALALDLLQAWRAIAARRVAAGRSPSADPAVRDAGLLQAVPPAAAGG